jgi:fumarate hydratase subunit beta
MKRITTPLTKKTLATLKPGEEVLISGYIYTARDAAHKRMSDTLKSGKKLDMNLNGQIIYYTGPTPKRPGKIIGSAGPTSSYRMDKYAVELAKKTGLSGTIGKGIRDREVLRKLKELGHVYFATIGGAGALLSQTIVECTPAMYKDLGAEAVYKLKVKDLPTTVYK